MSRVRVCLFVLFLILNVAVQFGDCENTSVNCTEDVIPGTDCADPSSLERILKFLEKIGKKPSNNIFDHLKKSDKKSAKSFSDSFKVFLPDIKLIFPGTLWCGDGNKAKNETDLGKFKKTDACCRAHDNCTSSISAGQILENLSNTGIFTRSACACDNAFYDCLKKVDSVLSKGIGKTYFDILGQQCFKCVCPTGDCDNNNSPSECKDQCTKYKWVDSRKF